MNETLQDSTKVIALHWAIPQCYVLNFTPLHCNTMHFTAVHLILLHYTSVLHCTKLHFNVLHWTKLNWTEMHWTAQPFDFLIRGFHELYFAKDDIPESLKDQLQSHEFISDDGEKCCRYLIYLAQTCQVRHLSIYNLKLVVGFTESAPRQLVYCPVPVGFLIAQFLQRLYIYEAFVVMRN